MLLLLLSHSDTPAEEEEVHHGRGALARARRLARAPKRSDMAALMAEAKRQEDEELQDVLAILAMQEVI